MVHLLHRHLAGAEESPIEKKGGEAGGEEEEEERMGFEKTILKAGTGPKPVKGQKVTVHCTGFGKDNDLAKKFWSTKDAGQEPFSFNIGQGSVIKGWDEGVMTMQVGEVARIQCTPDYAYGASGFPAWGIRPNSVLVFEIEVLSAQ